MTVPSMRWQSNLSQLSFGAVSIATEDEAA
jgi:hypothetical protein